VVVRARRDRLAPRRCPPSRCGRLPELTPP
jgi:hypothetical protein